MRTQDGLETKAATAAEIEVSEKTESVVSSKSYHELADVPVVEIDLLDSLNQNIAKLSDLHGRLNFVMREIRYLMKL